MRGTLIGHWVYLIGIGAAVGARFLPALADARVTPSPELRIMVPLLAVVALLDYALSLWLEGHLRARGPQGEAAFPIVTAAFGVSIAVYGMVTWFLGASGSSFWAFAGLALFHWVHSAVRWSSLRP